MEEYPFYFKEIPITKVARDMHQPRADLEESNRNHLKKSLEMIGIQQPLVVQAIGEGEEMFQIIDGHRRYLCAQDLGYKTVPCIVHKSRLKAGEFERIRLEERIIQMGGSPWKKQ